MGQTRAASLGCIRWRVDRMDDEEEEEEEEV
jgi:hypothetical protein